MGYESLIAIRHLLARSKRSLSVVTWLAVLGVALGVTALVGGFSVTTGFELAFRDKVLGVTAHVLVREYGLRFSDYRNVSDRLERIDGVKASSPMTYNEGMFSGRDATAGGLVKGIIPKRASQVLAIPEYMVEGSLLALEGRVDGLDGVVLGSELARRLGASTGSVVTVVSPLKSMDTKRWSAQPDVPTTKTFRVVGVFKAGFHEYDARLAYMELSVAQSFFGTGDAVVGIEVALDEPLQAGLIAEQIQRELGREDYSVLDWRRQNRNLFASLTYQRAAILIVLSVMVVLASCNVACMLIMLVIERTRDIAILKAMGATSGSIMRLFMAEGMVIGGLGTLLGLALAYGLCEGLLSNGIALDPKVYGISRLPVVFEPMDYLWAAVGALVITFLATIMPSLRGARMVPVDGLRDLRT